MSENIIKPLTPVFKALRHCLGGSLFIASYFDVKAMLGINYTVFYASVLFKSHYPIAILKNKQLTEA